MKTSKTVVMIQHMYNADLAISEKCNKVCHFDVVKQFFKIISRLGDGVFWYVLIIVLPFYYGLQGLATSFHMLISAAVALSIYKIIKSKTSRLRPFEFSTEIMKGTIALDRYSFPSGHTLQAISFTTIVLMYFPHLEMLLVPFTFLIAMSRVVLGLHYPTDVIAGAAIGYTVAKVSILLIGSSLTFNVSPIL